ncbi:LysM peptidoglycan-binding domain-containing protein (plasmid) [Streptomyces sp. C1-1]|uniref:LysM peptidoglycan-binding domain-containing protein n=1 Tax=Streptomyces sp. C1-1 TaxID=3231173 RepID=UPI003CFE231D
MRNSTRSPAAAVGRTLARVVEAAVSLLVLAGAVAGVPLLLAWATPVIWAATHDDVAHLLDRQDTGSVFLLLLACVGWIGWAQFSFCAVRELIAQLRGRTWRAPRGMGASQRAAALLIGSILVLLPTSSALASDAQAAPAPAAGLVPGQAAHAPRAAAQADQDSPASSASTQASRTYTVRETRPAESLWGIAEHELGDGERWREISDLNEGRTMADGTVFRANSFLQPGWQLQMPETAMAAGGVRTQLGEPPTDEKGGHVVTVHSGDYLSKIAEKELGNGDDWPQLFKVSRGKPQPHGLPEITDPDVIYAGQQVTLPGTQSHQPPQDQGHGEESGSQETTPPATQTPDDTQKPGGSKDDAPAPVPSQTQAPAPQSSTPSAPSSRPAEQPGQDQSSPSEAASATPEPSVSAPASAVTPSASAEPSGSAASSPATPTPTVPATAPASSPLNLRIVLGAGALLAAAVTGALALRRTLQRRRRKPGEKIAIAAETSPAEAQLAAAAEPGGAARLDVALRTLAHHVAQQHEADAVLPPLRAARIGTRAIQVLPEDLAQEPVAPFAAGQGGWWVLPLEAALLDEEAARDVPAPYPGLVTIGHTEAGDLLLLNLAALPALLLDGNPVHITEVCTSLALEVGMSPWATDVEVVTVGFGEDLPQLLPTARIAHMRQAGHALRDLSERLLEAHQMPDTEHQPYLLLCASSLDEDTAWQFADIIDRAGTVPVTLIAPASTAAARFPEAEILNASLSDPQTVDYAGTDITVQRLEHAAYQQITTALKVSGQPSHPAEGPWEDVPDELDSTQQPEHPLPQESAPAATAASIPSPAAATDVSGEVFPALLLSPTTASTGPKDEAASSTETTGLRAPAPPATTHAMTAAQPRTQVKTAGADQAQTAKGAQADGAQTNGQEPAMPADEEDGGRDPHAPEIRVLGPLEVDRVGHTGHGPKMAQLAALLYFRPGRNADVLCTDMDPIHPWSTSTLNARMQGLRSSLGSAPSGNPYVPRRKTAEDPYRLAPGIRCDWTRFLHLVERALPLGPAGLDDLERALGLVRGKPFGGRPQPWAEPLQQEMTTRIVDIAHTVATHRIPAGPHHNLSAARQAVATGLDADPTAELLYRDWMRLEAARGNRSGLHTAITRIQQINRELDCSPEPETTDLIHHLLHTPLQADPAATP